MRYEPAELEIRFIHTHFGGRAQDIAPLAAGEWSRAYALTLDGVALVMRFGAYRDDFDKDSVMAAHASDSLPIPRVLDIGEADEGFYALSERAPGRPLDDLGEQEIQIALPGLLDALEMLQRVEVVNKQGFGLWRPDGIALSQSWAEALLAVAEPSERLAGWRERLDAFPREARIFDVALERLRQLAPKLTDLQSVVHSDLLNRNVLVDDGRLTGLIDWGNSLYGDPLYDVAWLRYWWAWYPTWRGVDLDGMLEQHWAQRGGRPPDADERIHCYLIHIGLAHVAYSAWKGRREHLSRNANQLLTYL